MRIIYVQKSCRNCPYLLITQKGFCCLKENIYFPTKRKIPEWCPLECWDNSKEIRVIYVKKCYWDSCPYYTEIWENEFEVGGNYCKKTGKDMNYPPKKRIPKWCPLEFLSAYNDMLKKHPLYCPLSCKYFYKKKRKAYCIKHKKLLKANIYGSYLRIC